MTSWDLGWLDTYVEDWGGLLETEDFEIVGKIIAQASQKAWEVA